MLLEKYILTPFTGWLQNRERKQLARKLLNIKYSHPIFTYTLFVV
jgi:hypothetical protein